MAKKVVCLLITVALCVVVIYCLSIEAEGRLPLSVLVRSGSTEEKIHCWKDANGRYYFLLPSYASMEDAVLVAEYSQQMELNGTKVVTGRSCKDIQLGIPYTITYAGKRGKEETTVQFEKSANIPTIFIDSESGSMEYIHASKKNQESGTIRLYSADAASKGEQNTYHIQSIKGRGNSTWDDLQKKPYSIELDQEADLLGMGKAQEWILLANGYDPTNMRNKMVFDFANAVGMDFSPECQWVDLYLNGEYAGLYLLSERNEVHTERVNLQAEGSYLVSVELENRLLEYGRPHFVTNALQALRVHTSQEEFDSEQDKVADVFQKVENAILADNGIDPLSGKHWLELIDLDSWAKAYLIEEIFANYDGFLNSQFFYYDADADKVFAGPVWDYDLSMRDSLLECEEHDDVAAYRLYIQDQQQRPWFYRLCQNDRFMSRVKELYQQHFAPALSELLGQKMGAYTDVIAQASYMNETRWSSEETFDEDTKKVAAYLEKRQKLLERLWFGNQQYHIVEVNVVTKHYAYFPVSDGDRLSCLPTPTGTGNQVFAGWFYSGTDTPFDIERPITEDTAIYAKWTGVSNLWLTRAGKLLPAGIIAIMFLALLVADVRRVKKGG